MTKLEKYIDNEIVTTSAEVVDYCVNTLHLTNEAARQRIRRLPDTIYKIKGICSDNKSIIYRTDNWGDEDFCDKLETILKNHAKQHYYIIAALRANYGVVDKVKLASYSANPIEPVKGHRPFDSIIDDLKRLSLVSEADDKYYFIEHNEERARANSLINEITLSQFHEWARNTALISYDKATFHSSSSRYQFAMVAPSYVYSLTSKPKDKIVPAFVVADILLNPDLNEDNIQFFIKKLDNIAMLKQTARHIPFLIISSHKKDVYTVLKSKGVVIGNTDELFGKSYTETILGILNLLENAAAILMKNPDQYIKLINNINTLATGKTYNLKGELFEFAVGYYHSQQCQSIEISKKISIDSKMKEIDIYAVYQSKIIFVECKGYNSHIDDEYIENWISDKISTIRKWSSTCESHKGKTLEFEIWCTGGFSQESIERLDNAIAKTKKYKLSYFDADKMRKAAEDSNIPHFNEILKTYYIKEI